MTGNGKKILILLAIAILVTLFFVFDLQRYLTLTELKARQEAFQQFYAANRFLTLGAYFLFYILVTALSLPGAAVMTLAGGALFGFLPALIVVSFASTIGATLAFLVSRFLLRDWVQSKFGKRLKALNAGIEKDGGFYLFTLRLVPIFPFFVINLAMGLTPMRTLTYYWVSQLGMLPGTAVYVNAGTQLGQIETLGGILSPQLLLSFALLGIFPLIARKGVDFMQKRRTLKDFPKPKKFDYNIVVLGAGSAGLVSAYIAAAVKAKVALIEKDKMGGDCLNTGCVPSKALIRSAKMLAYGRRAAEFGLQKSQTHFDFAEVMERVQRVVKKVEPHDSVERYTELGVECIKGEARITSPYTVQVGERTLTTRNIIVATGAEPFVPPIPGLDQVDYLTSDNLWQLRELPKRLVVLGGGPIGCEMTQAFARFGAQVTQVEMAAQLMSREDADVAAFVRERFEAEGVRVLTEHAAKEVQVKAQEKILVCEHQGQKVEVPFDAILVAVGRRARTTGFGLEELGVRLSERGTIDTDPFLRTNFPNILCAGDVAGPYQFTHTAAHQAWYAAVNALFGEFKKFRADYSVIPWCTFTDPEVARVGLNEAEARDQNIEHEVTVFELAELDRAIAESEDHGWIKIITPPGKDKILGVTIVGTHAGDLLAEYILAMKHGLGLNKILGTIHPYPTLAEANKMAAGEWKKAHVPEKLLTWVEKFHAWRRG
ncbi:dihydrolipoamide dehydrogenase [Geoalkalibacter ferrihydriticus]|uniref:Pyridine nucleotide-disulfide oxidoreductase n=2 Tax=Geoalkalibacter ferrihydriticus TaxID=392333 RepID=A0A0C2EBD2_9BACT|nr:FAD-dependent oxidoreductase [Geoalkalibacter ferrihydriticus]KIH75908.1 pyridine nucleotide-disulfide oxidoreductase [Geoalkalibacter ferrihydriticus DSM 17813]SDM54584.1 dihydrolipoamide dehydrogenase [Geoalkalibacter ferrihydriticus]